MSMIFNDRIITVYPIADGLSLYAENFCAEAGIDADGLWSTMSKGGPSLWLDPDAPYMKYRGRILAREKFFVNLHPKNHAKYSYSGFQYDAMPHYYSRDYAPSSFVTKIADSMNANLRVNDEAVAFTQAIGTHYCLKNHNIGPHSDRPQDIKQRSWILDISLGGDRDFVMAERTDAEQTAWLSKPANVRAGVEPYVNASGKNTDRITMKHGSAILLSTATNSRWTHEVPAPVGDWTPRASLIFREIETMMSREELDAEIAKSRKNKDRALVAKEAKRAKVV